MTGYQTHIPLPAGLVSAAAGLGNSSFDGLAASAVDAYGATADRASTGSMGFDVPIPARCRARGSGVDFPTAPTTVGPFTASGGPVTIAEDQSTLVVAALSSKAFTMSCTAYPNDSVATSGSTGTAAHGARRSVPSSPPPRRRAHDPSPPRRRPPRCPPTTPTGPYELYCPGSPVGDIVLNDTTTTATITPSTLAQGQQFQLAGLQTQFSIPQSVVQQAEGLGLTQITRGRGDVHGHHRRVGLRRSGPITIVGTGTTTVLQSSGSSVPPAPPRRRRSRDHPVTRSSPSRSRSRRSRAGSRRSSTCPST